MDNLDFDDIVGDKYQPVEWLGGGAMSRVLKAKDTSIGNLPVAIKFLVPPARGATKGQEGPLLEREMEAMVRLHAHSYVVQVKDFGWLNDETPYLVMDFMPGGSLKDRLSAGPLTPALQRRVLEELCDALDFIHEQGIAHLDLKPSNIFLDRGLHTRIGDFGIAQALEQAYPDVVAAGTPGYMAPEQKDKQLPVDRRADIYALGIVTWQMLTGTLPEPRSPGDDRLHPELVKAIRRACSPDPSDRYDSAGAFWKSIRTWLPRRQVDGTTACPDYQFGNLLAQIPLTYRNRVRRVLEDYTAVFGGRDRELEALDEWLFDAEEPCGLLQAPAGRGKTALLANWTREMEHYGWRVVFHPISIRYETASMNTTVRCLGHALAPLFDADPPGLNESPEVVRARVVEWLRHGMPEDERLLLVVDGLDEAIGDYVKSLFPTVPGPRVKLLVSARPLAGTDRLWWVHQMKWDVPSTTVFDLSLLNHSDIADLLRGQPGNELNALADDAPFINELARVSEGDPLTAKVIIDALRAREIKPGSLSRRPPGLDAYLEEWTQQLQVQAESEAAWQLLQFCAIALGPLTDEDLAALAPDTFTSSRTIRQAVRTVRRFILGSGEPDSGYVFSHPRLREDFRDQLLESERGACRKAFVKYGQRAFEQLPNHSCPPYIRHFWATHLYEAGEWDELHRVVATSQGEKLIWAEEHHLATGNYTEFLSDLSLAWKCADELERPTSVTIGRQVRYALIESSIHSLARSVQAALVLALVDCEIWTPTQGLAYSRQSPDPRQRALALAGLIPHLPTDLHRQVVRETLEAARDTIRDFSKAQVLAKLAPHLPDSMRHQVMDEAMQAARESEDGRPRTSALVQLAPHLPASLREQALDEALSVARRIRDGHDRAQAVTALGPLLDEGMLDGALQVARQTREAGWRARALAGLLPHVSEALQGQLLDEAMTIAQKSDGYPRAVALAELVPYLPDALQETLLGEVLETTRELQEDWQRAEVVIHLAPYLPGELVTTAAAIVRDVEDTWWQPRALSALASCASEGLRAQLVEQALEAAQQSEDGHLSPGTLASLAVHLPKKVLRAALETLFEIKDVYARGNTLAALVPLLAQFGSPGQALQAADEIECLESWAQALVRLRPWLPEELQAEVLDDALWAVRETESAYWRAELLANLIPYVPCELQNQLLDQALEAARGIQEEWPRGQAVTNLVPLVGRLDDPRDALSLARGIEDCWMRSKALARLVPMLLDSLGPRETLDVACEIEKGWERAEALVRLSPRLPDRLMGMALEAARESVWCGDWSEALVGLAARLSKESQALAPNDELEAAQQLGKPAWQERAVGLVATWLAESGYTGRAVEAAAGIRNMEIRLDVFEQLEPHLVAWTQQHPSAAMDAWQESLRKSATRTRKQLVADLKALAPVIATLGGRAALAKTFHAIQDVGRWWP